MADKERQFWPYPMAVQQEIKNQQDKGDIGASNCDNVRLSKSSGADLAPEIVS